MGKNIYILVLFMLLACDGPLKYDIGLGDYEQEMVVNAAINKGDPALVRLSYSRSILDGQPYDLINDASVFLAEGNGEEQMLMPIGQGKYIGEGLIKENTTYRLRVVDRKGNVIRSNDTTPSQISFESIEITDTLYIEPAYVEQSASDVDITTDGEDQVISGLKISFDDEAGILNYYELIVYQKIGNTIEFLPINSTNLSVENTTTGGVIDASLEFYSKLLFNDRFFEGESFILEAEFRKVDDEAPVVVHLKSMSEFYYIYSLKRERDKISSEGFGEPVIVPTNIENGRGLFVGYSKVEVVL